MELLISLDELATYKSNDYCPIKCQQCSATFKAKKNFVKAALKNPKSNRLLFCSKDCQYKSMDKKIVVACVFCNITFKKIKSQITENNFCSRNCSAKYNNKIHPKRKPEGKCFNCSEQCRRDVKYCENCRIGAEIDFKLMKLSEMDEFYKDSSRAKSHYGWKGNIIREKCRSWNKHLIGNECKNCGYSKHTEFCHIKAISLFEESATLGEINDESNILMLCPNCHWEFDKGLLSL